MSPFEAIWRDGAFHPLDRYHNTVAAEFGEGECVRLERHEERSGKSHNHFFAALNDAWLNLPEGEAERFPSSEHLRKWALIRAGYRDERTFVAASKAEGERLVAFVKPMDDYAVVVRRDAVVTVYTAKSQSVKAMGKADFQASKDAVLEKVAALIGMQPAQLGKAA